MNSFAIALIASIATYILFSGPWDIIAPIVVWAIWIAYSTSGASGAGSDWGDFDGDGD